MLKYLILVALIAVVWWRWRQSTRPDPGSVQPQVPEQRMVACATCGVHVPETEAIADGQRHYCCASHQAAASSSRQS